MSSILRPRFIAFALLAVFATSACGDSEATQRKAFTDFLQTRILDKPGLHVPKPTEEETKSFGNYAKDYAIIVSFNEAMDKTITGRMQQVVQSGMIRSLDELTTRRGDIAAAIEGLTALRSALDEQLAKADAARAALTQPAELRTIYDKAYERTVTMPAKAFKDIFPAADNAFQAAQALAGFLDQHRDAIKINGSLVQTSDSKLGAELNRLISALNANGQAIMDAQRKLQALIQGS
ncbi:MAG: DUF3053 family protein [Hyphomicrobiales bacterium]